MQHSSVALAGERPRPGESGRAAPAAVEITEAGLDAGTAPLDVLERVARALGSGALPVAELRRADPAAPLGQDAETLARRMGDRLLRPVVVGPKALAARESPEAAAGVVRSPLLGARPPAEAARDGEGPAWR